MAFPPFSYIPSNQPDGAVRLPTSCQFAEYGPMSYGTIMLNEGRKYPIFTRDLGFTAAGQKPGREEKSSSSGTVCDMLRWRRPTNASGPAGPAPTLNIFSILSSTLRRLRLLSFLSGLFSGLVSHYYLNIRPAHPEGCRMERLDV